MTAWNNADTQVVMALYITNPPHTGTLGIPFTGQGADIKEVSTAPKHQIATVIK